MTHRRVIGLLLGVLPLLFALELVSGPVALDLGAALRDWLAGDVTSGSIILFEVRLPRALLALLTGASLALSGAALQGLLRNPLASPDILGVSQAAGLCAVLVLVDWRRLRRIGSRRARHVTLALVALVTGCAHTDSPGWSRW